MISATSLRAAPARSAPRAVRPRAHDVVAVHEDSRSRRVDHAVVCSPSCRRDCPETECRPLHCQGRDDTWSMGTAHDGGANPGWCPCGWSQLQHRGYSSASASGNPRSRERPVHGAGDSFLDARTRCSVRSNDGGSKLIGRRLGIGRTRPRAAVSSETIRIWGVPRNTRARDSMSACAPRMFARVRRIGGIATAPPDDVRHLYPRRSSSTRF